MRWFQSGSRCLGLEMIFYSGDKRAVRNANYNGDTNKNFNKDLCPLSKIPLWDFLFLLLDLTQQPSHSGQNSKVRGVSLKIQNTEERLPIKTILKHAP